MRIELSRYCSTHYGDIFTANHWADTDKIKHSYNQKQQNKLKQPCRKLLTYAHTKANEPKARFRGLLSYLARKWTGPILHFPALYTRQSQDK